MRRIVALAALVWLGYAAPCLADLSNPAALDISQLSPSKFSFMLTLPLINGRAPKARPVIPDGWVIAGDPIVRATDTALVRAWVVEADSNTLAGETIGVRGLLGTTLEIQLTVEMLDGARYEHVLRPTEPLFVVPGPPPLMELARDGIRRGSERVVRRPELALLVLVLVFLMLRRRALAAGIVAFAAAQGMGQWAASQKWVVMSAFLPGTLTALMAVLASVELLRGTAAERPWWYRWLWAPMLLLGLLDGSATPAAVSAAGLSFAEVRLAYVFTALGTVVGLALVALCARELRVVLGRLPKGLRGWALFGVGYLAGVLACALCVYGASVPVLTGRIEPTVPPFTLMAAAALGLWCRAQRGAWGAWMLVVACALLPTGLWLGVSGLALPLRTLASFGLLALLGVALALSARWPAWMSMAVVAAVALYHGNHAGHTLLGETLLPQAHAAGASVLVVFLLLACCRAVPCRAERGVGVPVRVCGAVAALLAVLWRLAEYGEWFGSEFAAESAMGVVSLPVLAFLLLLAALLAWPRRNRFQLHPTGGPHVTHWVLIAAAFFALPLGTWRVRNPFYTRRAPTATEATRILDMLLTDTYLAFNIEDESAAFDRLAENLSEELVADIYLDSRRRLTAGTREGAKVTVTDVSVASVGSASGDVEDDGSFTYPCTWAVTARVTHWLHTHSRQNAYAGELTIRVENDHWKICVLTLTSEERTVVGKQGS